MKKKLNAAYSYLSLPSSAPPAQSKATATSSELSVLFGHHCPQPHQPHQPHQPPQLPSNPVSAPDVREIPRHHGSYNLSHNGSYNPPPQVPTPPTLLCNGVSKEFGLFPSSPSHPHPPPSPTLTSDHRCCAPKPNPIIC